MPARPGGPDRLLHARLVEPRVRILALARQRRPQQSLRQPRQAGAMRGQILERDRAPLRRQPHAVGQMALNGVVERDEALTRHVREQRRRERLGDRSDLEDRPGTVRHPATVPEARLAVRADPDDESDPSRAALRELGSDAVGQISGHTTGLQCEVFALLANDRRHHADDRP
jgi:hypothetical protein